MRKVIVALLLVSAASQAQAVNLITNGDFSAGYTGFTSDYTPVFAPGTSPNALQDEGKYAVGTNAASYHSSWASYGDHTTGTGNYMIVNGAADTTKNVWTSNALALGPGTYTFTAYLSSACCNSGFPGTNFAPVLMFTDTVSGVTVGPATPFTVSNTGIWNQVTSSFTVAAGATGTVSLRNSTSAASGNDFGLDDISLEQTGAVPEPLTWAMMVGGFGLMGASMRRRRLNITYA